MLKSKLMSDSQSFAGMNEPSAASVFVAPFDCTVKLYVMRGAASVPVAASLPGRPVVWQCNSAKAIACTGVSPAARFSKSWRFFTLASQRCFMIMIWNVFVELAFAVEVALVDVAFVDVAVVDVDAMVDVGVEVEVIEVVEVEVVLVGFVELGIMVDVAVCAFAIPATSRMPVIATAAGNKRWNVCFFIIWM